MRHCLTSPYTIQLILLCLVLGLWGCEKKCAEIQTRRIPFSHSFDLRLADTPFQAQLAVAPNEMEQGLMFCKELGHNQGMLFVHRTGGQAKYWMRNVPIPLSIAFFDATGTLQEIHRMYPYEEKAVTSTSRSVQFALEMNAGWFREQGIGIGEQLDLDAVRSALQERGFDPHRYIDALATD